MNGREQRASTIRRLGLLCVGLALLCAAAAALSGFGHRFGLWGYGLGFSILRWAAYLALGTAAMALIVGVYSIAGRAWSGLGAAVLAVAVGLATAAVPYSYLKKARGAAPIHDITTDTEAPPRFVDILPLRAGAENSAEYRGQAVAAQQLRAYPDFGPVSYRLSPDQVFDRALEVARSLGWTIVAAVPDQGRIEATDQSFWFGFVDDIVIRVRSDPQGSRVDIRSASRQGVSDLGVNAARVQAFVDRLIAGSEVR